MEWQELLAKEFEDLILLEFICKYFCVKSLKFIIFFCINKRIKMIIVSFPFYNKKTYIDRLYK